MEEPTPMTKAGDDPLATEATWWPGLGGLKRGFLAGWAPAEMTFRTHDGEGTPLLLKVERPDPAISRYVAWVEVADSIANGQVITWRRLHETQEDAASPWHAARAVAIGMGWLTRAEIETERHTMESDLAEAEHQRADDVAEGRHLTPVPKE
jgi:hypothetical protein